jgi:putative acetyltransferase
MTTSIHPADPLSDDARRLIAALDAGLSGHYDAENNFPLLPEELVGDDIDFFMAETESGEKVGTIALRCYPDYAEIKRMFVTPSARGQGIARQLLDTAHARARSKGYRNVRLETGSLQHAAIALYESAGYVRRPAFGAYPPESDQNIYFECRLTSEEELA